MPASEDNSRPFNTTSASLLERVKANDEHAWQRLVAIYAPLVYFWCRRSGMNSEDAADIGQEVFRAVARTIGGYRHDRPSDTFGGWLRTITRNKIRDHARRHRAEPNAVGGTDLQMHLAQVPMDESEGSLAASPDSGMNGVCRRALNMIRAEFNPQSWQAFWQTAIEEQTSSEVAEKLGMTAVAVRKAKSRVMRRLREELGEVVE